jgi:hypothetical protein
LPNQGLELAASSVRSYTSTSYFNGLIDDVRIYN